MSDSLVPTGKVKLVWHNLAFLGPESVWAAEAAECAADQGKFWEYHDKLFEEQSGENQGAFEKPSLERFAAELGLDTARFDQCLASGQHRSDVESEREQGMAEGVHMTPTLIVGGQKYEGVPTFDQLRQMIDAAIAKKAAQK